MRLALTGALVCVALYLAALPCAHGAEGPVAWSATSGGHVRGEWSVDLRGGWPRFAARAQVGVGKGWSPTLELVGTPSWRVEPSLGVTKSVLRGSKGRLVLELLAGWQVQTGSLAQRGPSLVARVRPLIQGKKAGFWASLGTRHTVLFDRTTRRSVEGTDVSWSARHRWSPEIGFGGVFVLTPQVSLTVGLDLTFVDLGTIALSLPGFQAGLQFGRGAP